MDPLTSEQKPSAVVLGASHWHAPLYVAALAQRFQVLAVQDAQTDAVLPFAEAVQAPVTPDVSEALAHDNIDIAFVLSPHHEMPAIARLLIARKIPFVIEKPAATNMDDLRAIECEARAAGVPATIAFVQRNAPIDLWLRQVGEIFYERMAFIAGPPDRYRAGSSWMLDPRLSGGGSLMNLGPHFVDMAISHIGEPARFFRTQRSSMHQQALDDHSTLVLATADGKEAIIEVGYAFPDSPLKRYCSFSAAGSQGFASIDTSGSAMFTDTKGITHTAELNVDSDPLYAVFVNNVADTLSTGFAGMSSLADLSAAMESIWSPSPATEAFGG